MADNNDDQEEEIATSVMSTSSEMNEGNGAAAKSTGDSKVSFTSETATNDDDVDEISNPQSAMRETLDEGEQKEESSPHISIKSSPADKQRRQHNTNRVSLDRSNSTRWKTRKRGRRVRVATVRELSATTSFPPLPKNQYTTTLRRRAVRKAEEENDTTNQGDDSEDYGDISLGMKLIVVGGRVIVQSLNSLADGRASPAQLTGMIQRGDVLLAIGNVSLFQMPIDKLMEGLRPLSSPDDADGNYRRTLQFRFQSGVGLAALKMHEEAEIYKSKAEDAANEMFSLFPMVDQLSGTPLFDDLHHYHAAKEGADETENENVPEEEKDEDNDEEDNDEDNDESSVSEEAKSPDGIISLVLALEAKQDKERFTSEFYEWSDDVSGFLKKAVEIAEATISNEAAAGLTQSERFDLGMNVMKLAKTLSLSMEDIDKGKDMRSFKMWSSNFSLKSSASARRRYVMDTASLRSHRNQQPEIEEGDESVESDAGSGSLDGIDGDTLLLGLAAHDEIWQKQVVQFLKESISEMEKKSVDGEQEEKEDEDEKGDKQPPKLPDMNSALSKELGSLLFGENMAKIISKKKRSYALPTEEITTVLFDLTTNIATTAPDEITVFGGQNSISHTFQSGKSVGGNSKSAHNTKIILASQFLLDEALPFWLESFRPLPWEHRRVLWPRLVTRSSASGITIGSDADSLTMGSVGSASPSLLSGSQGRPTKDLREIIEDQELDIETRSETCFLVTYYFTQSILTRYSHEEEEALSIDGAAVAFIKKYGAYLQLHSCLSCAAAANAAAPINELLLLASHDPTHREAVREIKKAKSLTFYEAGKLSAVLIFLNNIPGETKTQRREVIKNICVSAYPDVQPWQVRRVCSSSSKDSWLQDFYYSYLSMLLHPMEGNEEARSDGDLVKEWCEWSVGVASFDGNKTRPIDSERRSNFLSVTSRSSSDHLAYKRDLPVLLKLSMATGEHYLALDLAAEILGRKGLVLHEEVPSLVLSYLKDIGASALEVASEKEKQDTGFRLLKRVLKLFHKMSVSDSQSCRESIIVADEIYALFQKWKSKSGSTADDARMFDLIDFVVDQSSPMDALTALIKWASYHQIGHSIFSRLDALLSAGARDALKSGQPSLFRLQQARMDYSKENRILSSTAEADEVVERNAPGIWTLMSNGDLSLNK